MSEDLEEDVLRLSKEEFEEFYENFGSKNFQLQSRVLEDYGSKQIDIYFKSIGFATTVIATIGIIAGFGFTAFGYVIDSCLFFIGEALLLGGIFYGLFWIQNIYQGEYSSLNIERNKFKNFYDQRNQKFMVLYNSWVKDKIISKADLKELNDTDMGSINLFKTEGDAPVKRIYSPLMYGLIVVGALLLIGSFIF